MYVYAEVVVSFRGRKKRNPKSIARWAQGACVPVSLPNFSFLCVVCFVFHVVP